jgi:hypothetical protein
MIDFDVSTCDGIFLICLQKIVGARKSQINSSPLTDLSGMVVLYCVLSLHTGVANIIYVSFFF